MDSRADPAQEHTPLLGSRRTAEHGANDENGSDGIRVTTLHSYYKFLCIGTASSLGFAVPGLAFMIASAALTSYGARRFSFYEDWNFTVLEEVLGLASFIAIPLAITNLVLLKRRRGQVPSLVNIIYFGSTGLFCVGWAMVYIGDRISNPPSYCPKDLDDPDTGFGSGTYEECLRWAPKHRAVTWIFLILMGLYGLNQCVLLVAVIIGLFRNRSNASTYARWYIPEGQLAFEVRIRWGSPRDQRQSQVESSEGNRETE